MGRAESPERNHLKIDRLHSFFAALAPLRSASGPLPRLDVTRLARLFAQLAPLRGLPPHQRVAAPEVDVLMAAFAALKEPFARERARGGLINPWQIAGLKRNEMRNAATLAGLWSEAFGGTTSQQFLARYLEGALPEVGWDAELAAGYRIRTELCPMGDQADRVDLVIETPARLVGIEIKVDAVLGPQQLERYCEAIAARARLGGRRPHVILLAPRGRGRADDPGLRDVTSTTWRDVARAARHVVGPSRRRDVVGQLIARFADHIDQFC